MLVLHDAVFWIAGDADIKILIFERMEEVQVKHPSLFNFRGRVRRSLLRGRIFPELRYSLGPAL